MNVGDIDSLNAELNRAAQDEKRHFKQMLFSISGYLVALIALVSLMPFVIHAGIKFPHWGAILIPCCLFSIIGILMPRCFRKQRTWNVLDALAQTDDLRAIGHIASSRPDTLSGARSRYYVQTLTRLLPHLQQSDARLFTSKHQENLFCLMSPRYSNEYSDFQSVFLKTLEQFGDSKALPVIKRLATMKPNTQNEQCVQTAAQESLHLLQQKFRTQQSEHNLLRASGTTLPDTSALLRSTTGTQEPDASELLLPSSQDRGE